MIEEKFVEIRDAGTTIPALAFKINPSNAREQAMMARAGYGADWRTTHSYVFLLKLDGLELRDDPFGWTSGCRTMKIAHTLLIGPEMTRAYEEIDPARALPCVFENLPFEGKALIDIEYVLGLRAEPKVSEF